MNPLKAMLKSQLPLGIDDNVSSIPAPVALDSLFHELRKKFGSKSDPAPIFSCDSYDSDMAQLGVDQLDVFQQTVASNKIPNGQICHMRVYSSGGRAHWHAMFAQLDEHGEIKEIIVTDSRQKGLNQGITAQPDMDKNLFLQLHKQKIKYIPGEQQPPSTTICWVHAIANLASLASNGKVYSRKKTGRFVDEIHDIFMQADAQPTPSTLGFFSPHKLDPVIVNHPKPTITAAKSLWETTANFSLITLGTGILAIGSVLGAQTMAANPLLGLAVIISSIIVGLALSLVGLYLANKTSPLAEPPIEIALTV